MYYMRPNIQRNPHPKPCLLDQAHVIGNCLYRPWMTMKQWREIIIGRPRALCFICSVFVHIKPCGATTPTCHLLPAGTGIACSTAIASTSSPSLCWWRHSFLPWPAAGALHVVAWKNIVQHEQIQWNFVARIFLNFMSDKDFVPCLSRAMMESRSVSWRYWFSSPLLVLIGSIVNFLAFFGE